jgi:Tfp pilus assembly protein PilP
MATNTTTARWSPVTKLSILGAAVAVPYLLWTAPDSGAPAVARPPARAVEDAGTGPAGAAATAPAEAARRRALPPLQAFAAVVERPLFAPTRRFARPVDAQAPEPEAVAEAEDAPPEPEAAGPERPDLRFFGTVRQGGKMAALVTGEAGVGRLRVGDAVGDWQVAEVTRDRLVLVYEDEKLAYEIFGKAAADDGED